MPVTKKSLTKATPAAKPTTKSLKTSAPASTKAVTALRTAYAMQAISAKATIAN